MYKLIGADGSEYGPVTADQLRQWIFEGRANAHSRVWSEGANAWKPLAEFPELAPLLASAPAAIRFAGTPRTHPLATTGMIMGILSLTLGCCCYGVPFNLLGIIFSLVALAQIKANPLREQGRGLAIAGLVMSLLSVLLALLLLLCGVALNFSDGLRKIQQL